MDLKEKRGKFLRDFYDLVEGDDSRSVFDQELYSFGENQGYTKDEIYSLALHFDGLGLMKAESVMGRRIAVLRLTAIGTRYIEEGEKGLEHQYYGGLERQHSERKIIFNATAKSTVLGKPCVFLCYARSDGTAVRELYRFLQSHRFKPWIDTEDIPAGAEWEPTINKAIQHSDFFFSFCASHETR